MEEKEVEDLGIRIDFKDMYVFRDANTGSVKIYYTPRKIFLAAPQLKIAKKHAKIIEKAYDCKLAQDFEIVSKDCEVVPNILVEGYGLLLYYELKTK